MAKHPGAPRGNTNALKHGFYSRHFTRQESRDLDRPSMGCMQDEIIFLKIIIDRIAQHVRPSSSNDIPLHETVLTLHVVAQAVSRLSSLINTNRCLDATGDDQIIAFLREHGFTEDQVRREFYGGGSGSPDQLSVTHGFYASNFTPEEIQRLSRWNKKDLKDEISLLRILIKRTDLAILAHEKVHSDERRDAPRRRPRQRRGRASGGATCRSAQLDTLHAYQVLVYAISSLERLERSTGKLHQGERPPRGILNRAIQEYHDELAAKKANSPLSKSLSLPEGQSGIWGGLSSDWREAGSGVDTPHAQSP